MEDKYLRAIIIKELVDENCYTQSELCGINRFINNFEKQVLELMCDRLNLDYE